ncbi:MAG: methyltransferase domain-containing protein [Acidobacteria bacterium]|nr:MAG: methyltransferase domain-containing protein [Acidobacteriota bacterium]
MSTPGRQPAGLDPAHYSYAHYADRATAGGFDRLRFSGPIGTLLAETQEALLLSSVPGLEGRSVLDVGTGTGRAALVFARGGGRVTGVDASAQMLEVARERAAAEGLTVEWLEGDAHSLSFPDRSFDAAISLRVLMHTPDWRRCLGELCRVARERVVFDYPALVSGAALQAAGRRVAAALGRRTEAYRVFSEGMMARELARHGFAVHAVHRQFVLPIAVHKAVGSRRFTLAVEGLFARVGLLWLLGSPVTVVAVREGSRRA